MTENDIAKTVFGSALSIHRELGPGLLERTYLECLFHELKTKDLFVEKQKPLPIEYEGVTLDVGFRVDLFIEQKFIVQVKSVEALNDIHLSQILTFLKLTNCKAGMLINFNVALVKHGVKRVRNNSFKEVKIHEEALE